MLTKNQRAEVRIESCTPEGYGVCRLEGRAVFVASAMPGERWEILILKVTASAVWAKGLRLLEPSSCRCEPDCPNLCGGCSLRHMRYEEELRLKKEHVDDCLRRGDFGPINEWNRQHIWQYGCLYRPGELFEKATGEAFDPTVYANYLEEKFSALYNL